MVEKRLGIFLYCQNFVTIIIAAKSFFERHNSFRSLLVLAIYLLWLLCFFFAPNNSIPRTLFEVSSRWEQIYVVFFVLFSWYYFCNVIFCLGHFSNFFLQNVWILRPFLGAQFLHINSKPRFWAALTTVRVPRRRPSGPRRPPPGRGRGPFFLGNGVRWRTLLDL